MLKNNTMPTLSTLQKICEGLGITMAQLFVEEGTRIDLTDQQKELLSLWDSLPLNMQARVIGYLEGLKENQANERLLTVHTQSILSFQLIKPSQFFGSFYQSSL